MDCPGSDSVEALIEGRLAASERDLLSSHIESCQSCREVVQQVRSQAAHAQTLTDDARISGTELDAPADRADAEDPPAGTLLGRYEVERRLGAGAMGVVLAARDPQLGRRVAIKLLRADRSRATGLQARLTREAQALARVRHPNVVAVHDIGTWNGQVFLAMELVEGQTLRGWLAERARGWRETSRLLLGAGRGLAAAHAAGIVHRDFKPDNVLVGAGERAAVTDFGLARPVEDQSQEDADPTAATLSAIPVSGLTRTGALIGTPAYMAPEQLAGQPSGPAADQFGFCVTLYEALYGERPFQGASLKALREAIERAEVRPAPKGRDVPGWVRRVLLRGLAADPDARYPSMDALVAALSRDRRASLRLGAAAAAGAIATTAIVITLWGGDDREAALPPCSGGEEQLIGVWDAAVAGRVRAAMAAVDHPEARSSADRVVAALGDYTARWSTQRRQACEATRRGEQTTELLELRMACLDDRLAAVGALARILAEPDAQAVDRAPLAVDELASLEDCADAERLRALVAPPDPQAAEEVAAVRMLLASVRAGLITLRGDQVQAALAEARRRADAVGYPPLIAEAALAEGISAWKSSDWASAVKRLRDAAVLAEAAGHDRVKAEAGVYLVTSQARAGNPDEALSTARATSALLARMGGDPALSAALEEHTGALLVALGRPQEAVAHFEQAVRLREGHAGGDRTAVVGSLMQLAFGLRQAGRNDEADRAMARVSAITGRAGGDDLQRVEQLMLLEHAAQQRGDFEQAYEYSSQTLALLRRRLPPDSDEVAQAWFGRGLNLDLAERFLEARAAYLEAAASYQRRGDAVHLAEALGWAGSASIELGDWARAEELCRRSGEVAARAGELARAHLHRAMHCEGRAMLEQGDVRGARRGLERSLAYRERDPGSSAAQLGHGRFHLARALWESGMADRPRAMALATSARQTWVDFARTLQGQPRLVGLMRRNAERQVAIIDRWLEGRR